MRLSREKILRLSHLAVDAVAEMDEGEFIEDRNTGRIEIVRILTDLLREEERMEELARQKILSQKKPIPEGFTEWETLYRKYYSDELRKLGVEKARPPQKNRARSEPGPASFLGRSLRPALQDGRLLLLALFLLLFFLALARAESGPVGVLLLELAPRHGHRQRSEERRVGKECRS